MGRLGLSLLLMLPAGCLLELDGEASCGDGRVDRSKGEECDPENEASYANKCENPQGVASCDPNWCELDLRSCSPLCGNGTVDLEIGEECDPTAPSPIGPNVFGTAIACASLDGGAKYTAGETYTCADDCRWDRSPCSQCGDGTIQSDEVCEPEREDFDAANDYCYSVCVEVAWPDWPDAGSVQCAAECKDDCSDYTLQDPGAANCCIGNWQRAHAMLDCCGSREGDLCVPGLSE